MTNFLTLFIFLLCTLRSYARQEDALGRLFYDKLHRKLESNTYFPEQADIVDQANILPQDGLKQNDRIEKLPSQPHVRFDQYGGYVTVDKNAGRAFYYYFVETENEKESKPLLLWLNGGPGCSSLGYGAMQELGPFRVHSDGKTLFQNPYAWNKVANVLFLESPAGVGFSYSNTSSDYTRTGDRMTANDNYVFLVNWLERFPEYKTRDFYISGESYAGHYVPQLADTILQHNRDSKMNKINLKGIIIGNALINDETDNRGQFDYFWNNALISDEVNQDIHKYCNFSTQSGTPSEQCLAAVNEANMNYNWINVYNIYGPTCHDANLTRVPKKSSLYLDPCSEFYVTTYLNNPEVQKVMHANVTNLKFSWEPCSITIKWNDSSSTTIPLLKELMENGLRVWVISGDNDGRIPVTSTKYSLKTMKLQIKDKYRPWFVEGEVGGYTEVYKGDLTFATVRGAGHQIPSFQAERALTLIKHFLLGKVLPINQ